MTFLFANNAKSSLASGISDVATSLTVQAGDGLLFPNPTGVEEFRCVIYNLAGDYEIIKVTTRATDAFSVIVRGQETTSAAAWSADDYISLRTTKESLDYLLQHSDVDDTPVNGATDVPVSSNRMFDHEADTSAHGGPYNNYVHPDHSGHVTSTADGATVFTVSGITGQSELASGLAGTDELVVSDNGTIKRMDVSVMNAYFDANLSFNDYTHPSHTARTEGLDTGPLTGATVISDLDFNLSSDTSGHVTACDFTNATTRELTPGDIGALALADDDVVFDAKLDGFNESGALNTAGTDLDDYTVNGSWRFFSQNLANTPADMYGFCSTILEVRCSEVDTDVVQTVTQLDDGTDPITVRWMRSLYDSTWGDWYRIGGLAPKKSASLLNSWTGLLEYYLDLDGYVHFWGLISGGTYAANYFVFPAGFRPNTSYNYYFTTDNGGRVSVQVKSNGDVIATAQSASHTSLFMDGTFQQAY